MNISDWVHFSIDDVIGCFKWIYENQPESIFEEPMLKKLLEWHNKYKLQCDLYVFEECDGFSLDMLQDRYWDELKMSGAWLKLAWHAPRAETQMDKIKTGSSDEKELILSLKRTYELIQSKTDGYSQAYWIRLHMCAAPDNLLTALRNELGFKFFLTSYKNIASYDLNEIELDMINRYGCTYVGPVCYSSTDMCLDMLSGENSVSEMIGMTENGFEDHPFKYRFEIFCHEEKFHEISDAADEYWSDFGNIRKPLFANTAVQKDDKIYFNAYNTRGLYALNTEKNEIEIIAQLPCKSDNTLKFMSMNYFNGCLWMMPDYEKEIMIYDIANKRLELLPVPFIDTGNTESIYARKSVKDGKYLWVLPYDKAHIVRINTEDRTADKFSDWPEEVSFDKNEPCCFEMIFRHERYIYFIKCGCSHNLKINMDSLEISLWDRSVPDSHGIITDNNKLVYCPRGSHEGLVIKDMISGSEDRIVFPEWVWKDEFFHSFWNMKQIGDKIYILPHEANAIIVYSINSSTADFIPVNEEKCLSVLSSYAGFDTFAVNDSRYFYPHCGNTVLITYDDKKISRRICLSVPVKNIPGKEELNIGDIITENTAFTLQNFIEMMTSYYICDWKVLKENGKEVLCGQEYCETESTGSYIYEYMNMSR